MVFNILGSTILVFLLGYIAVENGFMVFGNVNKSSFRNTRDSLNGLNNSNNLGDICQFTLPKAGDNIESHMTLTWFPVGKFETADTFVVSAFLDVRFDAAYIVILGITKVESYFEKRCCRIWNKNLDVQFLIRTKGSVTNRTVVRSGYYELIYKCNLENIDIDYPYYVSLIEEECEEPLYYMEIKHAEKYLISSSSQAESNVLNKSEMFQELMGTDYNPKNSFHKTNFDLILSTIEPIPHNKNVNFTICSPSMVWNDLPVDYLIEWIELNRLLGFEKFTFFRIPHKIGRYQFRKSIYNSKRLDLLLDFYSKKGIIQVYNWTFPVEFERLGGSLINGETYILRIDIALTYCLYNNMYSTKYIANLAFDEYIVPQNGTLYELFDHPDHADHQFRDNNEDSLTFDNDEILDTNHSRNEVDVIHLCNAFYMIFGDLKLGYKKSHAYSMKTMILMRRYKGYFCHKNKYLVRSSSAIWLSLFDVQFEGSGAKIIVNESLAILRSYLLLRTFAFASHDDHTVDFGESDDVSMDSHIGYVFNILFNQVKSEENVANASSSDDDVENESTQLEKNRQRNGNDTQKSDDRGDKKFIKWLEERTEIDTFMEQYEEVMVKRYFFITFASKIYKVVDEEFRAKLNNNLTTTEKPATHQF